MLEYRWCEVHSLRFLKKAEVVDPVVLQPMETRQLAREPGSELGEKERQTARGNRDE